MEMTTTVEVMQVKRFKMEDNGFAATTLYCVGNASEESNENSMGIEIVKMRGDYELFETLRGIVPGKLELTTFLSQGGKDKAEIRVKSARPVNAVKPAAK